jgi:hypothetical protein
MTVIDIRSARRTERGVADIVVDEHRKGFAALLLTGRSLVDFDVDADGHIRACVEILRKRLFDDAAIHLTTYSLASGFEWGGLSCKNQGELERLLRKHGLLDVNPDENEAVRIMRGVQSLIRQPTGFKWEDERDAHLGFLFEFGEHLTPCTLNGAPTEAQLHCVELANRLGNNLAPRKHGHLVLFHGREGLIDPLVISALRLVRLPQPDAAAKRRFITALQQTYAETKLDAGLDADAIARLTANTPNRGLEELFRESHRSGIVITARRLSDRKNRDVEEVSEHTLQPIDVSSPDRIELRGRNIETPLKLIEAWAEGLARRDTNTPRCVIFTGSPGSGKTTLVEEALRHAKVSGYTLLSPKGSLVGETERKAREQFRALNEWGGIGRVDEITEAFSLERNEFNGDSGASQAVTATLLTELSNESARGHRLIVGTTNCPWRMGEAMRNRFRFVPVLNPLLEDVPQVILAITRTIGVDAEFDDTDPMLRRAAELFHAKAANPRDIRDQISDIVFLSRSSRITAKQIVDAALDFTPSCDVRSVAYADLWAIRVCSRKSYLPWSTNPASYPYPPHFVGVVDARTGEIDLHGLDAEIERLKPYANV